MATFLDLVHEQHPTRFPKKVNAKGQTINTSEIVKGATVVRRPADITGITLHQTACVFGPLDDPEKKHRRALKIPAHVIAFRDGTYVQGAPLLWFLFHGNALNGFSLGLEMEGQYPGLKDDPVTPQREDEKTFWGAGKPTPVDATSLDCFRAALTHLVYEGRKLGCPIEYLWAHRQSSADRRSDPGQELWERVGLEHGVEVLGLKLQPERVWRDGRPIPAAWGGPSRFNY